MISYQVRERRERTPTKQGSSSSSSRMSPTPVPESSGAGDRQFVVIASEKQARVVALPSQNCVYRQQIVDTDFVVKAEIVSLKGICSCPNTIFENKSVLRFFQGQKEHSVIFGSRYLRKSTFES